MLSLTSWVSEYWGFILTIFTAKISSFQVMHLNTWKTKCKDTFLKYNNIWLNIKIQHFWWSLKLRKSKNTAGWIGQLSCNDLQFFVACRMRAQQLPRTERNNKSHSNFIGIIRCKKCNARYVFIHILVEMKLVELHVCGVKLLVNLNWPPHVKWAFSKINPLYK